MYFDYDNFYNHFICNSLHKSYAGSFVTSSSLQTAKYIEFEKKKSHDTFIKWLLQKKEVSCLFYDMFSLLTDVELSLPSHWIEK